MPAHTAPIALERPLADSEAVPAGYVVLVACDQTTRVAVNFGALKKYSPFAESVFSAFGEGEGGEAPVLPLDTERAPPEQLVFFATWIKHHETVPPSRIEVPMPRRLVVDELFTDPWDLAFIRQHFVGPEDDMTRCKPLYGLALFSVYLQVQPLTEMIATFFAFKIRRGVRETGEPTKMVRRWFGKEGDYTLEEIKTMTDWVRDACKDMELPKRASYDDY